MSKRLVVTGVVILCGTVLAALSVPEEAWERWIMVIKWMAAPYLVVETVRPSVKKGEEKTTDG